MDKFFLLKMYNIFFPIKCGYCGEITQNYSYVCEKCNKNIDEFEIKNRCKFCGKKLIDKNRICSECRGIKFYYDEYIYYDEYKEFFKDKMLQYKFYDKKFLKNFFAQELSKCLTNVNADYVIGVPISRKRMKERGYNQTELIAREIGNILNIEYLPNALVKIKDTEHQINLSKKERKNNVKDSFKMSDIYDIKGKKILLVDDIFTTGATVNECSRVLKKAKAQQVIVSTILRKK